MASKSRNHSIKEASRRVSNYKYDISKFPILHSSKSKNKNQESLGFGKWGEPSFFMVNKS
jgi:hypothetical protein